MEMQKLHSKILQIIVSKYKAKSQEADARLCVLSIILVITVWEWKKGTIWLCFTISVEHCT